MASKPSLTFLILTTILVWAVASSSGEAGEWVTWTDATGKFSVEAEYVSSDNTQVTLRKKDGSTVSVPLERLSPASLMELGARKKDEIKPILSRDENGNPVWTYPGLKEAMREDLRQEMRRRMALLVDFSNPSDWKPYFWATIMGLYVVAFFGGLFGLISLVVAGFRYNLLYGLGMFFIPPLTSFVNTWVSGTTEEPRSPVLPWIFAALALVPYAVFVFRHWKLARLPFLMALIGGVLSVASALTLLYGTVSAAEPAA